MLKYNSMKDFPPLPLEAWEPTKITLHLWLQIVGKIKLDLVPRLNHWWHITFRLGPTGLTTGPIPYGNQSFQVDFNLREHLLEVHTSWGDDRSFELMDGLTVAQFYAQLFEILKNLKIKATITPVPYDHPCTEPFADCESHSSYDQEYAKRFWHVLSQVDHVFKEFSGHYYGKVSPSQLYWHHMDLAVTRFSGQTAPKMPDTATIADREAYSHEVISAGFWAGDEQVRGAAFYSYTYPSPEGINEENLAPDTASWVDSNGSPMAMLMYDDLLKEKHPKQALMAFLASSYRAGAKRANWSKSLEDPNF